MSVALVFTLLLLSILTMEATLSLLVVTRNSCDGNLQIISENKNPSLKPLERNSLLGDLLNNEIKRTTRKFT